MASRTPVFCSKCHAGDKWGPSECECKPVVPHQEQAPAKVQVLKKGPCKVHMSGRRCEGGISCPWSHDEELPPCKHFLQGKCTRGGCKFPHVGLPAQPAPQSKKQCRNIAEGRECPWGERCHFAH